MEDLEKDQARPLAHPPTPATSYNGSIGEEEETRRWRSSQYLRKRRCLLFCCGCCGATVTLVGVTILVLVLTVFKIEDPGLAMNSIHVQGLNVDPGIIDDRPPSVNATLTADISIKNPNVASFGFASSVTTFYYEGETVGAAYAPGGRVSADGTVRMNVTVDVLVDRVAGLPNATSTAIIWGTMNLTSFTDVKGRVDVLGVYKRNLDVVLNCSMTLDLASNEQEVSNKACQATAL